jgi:hypothetical protein
MNKEELKTESLALTEGNTGQVQAVGQLDLHDSFRTLGIHKTISGNQAVQIAEMKRKSDAYARGILSVNVTNFERSMDRPLRYMVRPNELPLGSNISVEKRV